MVENPGCDEEIFAGPDGSWAFYEGLEEDLLSLEIEEHLHLTPPGRVA